MRPGSWFTQIILATTLFLPGFQPPVSRYEGGDPFIHNFRPEEYKGSAQIFSAFEDSLGQIYFATNEGILIYNGQEWRQVTLPTVPGFPISKALTQEKYSSPPPPNSAS